MKAGMQWVEERTGDDKMTTRADSVLACMVSITILARDLVMR